MKEYAEARIRGIRIVSSMRKESESDWYRGEWAKGRVYLSKDFELGLFLPHHHQDFHAHTHSYEIYIFIGRGEVDYAITESSCIETIKVEPGDVAIFPPLVYHKVRLRDGYGYAIIIRTQGYKGGIDKVILDNPRKCK
jgi:mannose-6-phosphate isomerase-like protein (cupin superfamily)